MKNSKKRAATSMPIVLMFFMSLGMVTVVSVGLSQTTDSMVFRGTQKVQANELAESGIQSMYDEVCRKMKNGSILNQNLNGLMLNSTLDGVSRDLGTFSAEVTDVTHSDLIDPPGYAKGTIQRTYRFQLKGIGRAPNGTESIMMASFNGQIVAKADGFNDPMREWVIYPAAIQSNSDILIKADSNIRTLDINTVDKEAHMIANRGVRWQPAHGSKTSITAPDVISVDGHILVPNQPTETHYLDSKSALGFGNYTSTVKNYQSAGPWVNKPNLYPVVANEVTPMGLAMPFPSVAQLISWHNRWNAVVTNHPDSQVLIQNNTSQMRANTSGLKTITAPARLTAGLTVDANDTIHLIPKSDDPSENIIKVNGAILNQGNIVNHGVTLVCSTYQDTTTATYNLDKQYTKYPDLSDVYKNAGLIATATPVFNPQSGASSSSIWIRSDVDGKYGLVYALEGFIKVTGSLELNGLLLAGGASSNKASRRSGDLANTPLVDGGIHIEPDDSDGFTLVYSRESKGFTLPGALVDASKVVVPFRAAALANWMQKK
ncbi:hypothetical protein C0431_13915 [bacterium]|nr:hypothetical protein [bacterium]